MCCAHEQGTRFQNYPSTDIAQLILTSSKLRNNELNIPDEPEKQQEQQKSTVMSYLSYLYPGGATNG